VGWPNGSFTPSLRALSVTNGVAALEVDEGGAFVWDDSRKTFLGGTLLVSGTDHTIDGLIVRPKSELQINIGSLFADVVEVLNQKNEILARFSLPAKPRRPRVLPLRSLVEANGATSPEEAKRLVEVGKWAADKRLLLAPTGETRLLGTDPYRVECRLVCKLSLLWPNQQLPLRVSGDGARLGITFLPPWRIASPLPPQPESGERKFTLTAVPRPDDIAFIIPLGHAIPDSRPSLTIGRDAEGKPVFTGPGAIVGSNPPPSYLPQDAKTPPNPNDFAANVTSQIPILFDRTAFTFATVNDLPSPKGLLLLVFLALATYGLGLLMIGARSPNPTTRWVIYGLSACLWNLLVFRLLLASRFALDPTRLDTLTVKGVTLALTAIAVVPGLFLLWARLRADLNARLLAFSQANSASVATSVGGPYNPAYLRSLIFLGVLIIVFVVEFWRTPYLWSNPPAAPSVLLVSPFIFLAVYLFLLINCVHLSYLPGLSRPKWLLFILPLRFDASLGKRGQRLWTQFAHEPRIRPVRLVWWVTAIGIALVFLVLAVRLQPASGLLGNVGTVLALVVTAVALLWILSRLVHRSLGKLCAASVIFLVVPSLARMLPGSVREIAQEVVALFVFSLVPALFWLSLTLIHHRPGNQVPWSRIIFLTITAVLLPVFAMPKFLGDMGSGFATFPLFLAVALILALTPSWRASTAILGMLLCGFLIAGISYRYFSQWLPGAAEVRLVTYWQGSEIERLIPWARATRGGEGISLQRLRDAYQHVWESKAIAHEGEWWGVGYGNAPTHLSQVRQDTIQFDSLFSFFVASEHGVPGGLSLLLLFVVPLALVSFGAWQSRMDFGYAGTLLVFAWLFLEAVLHAGMNLGTFPFTGRGMPVINVNSTSDLLRWLLLFAFAAQLLHWRDPDGDSERTAEDTKSITSIDGTGATQTQPVGVTKTTLKINPLQWSPRGFRAVIATCLVLLPLLVITVNHARLILDKDFPRTFEWAGVLGRIRNMIEDQVLLVNQKDRTIEPDWRKLPGDFNVPDGALIKQEILRFNALPPDERLDEQSTTAYNNRIRNIGTTAEYDRLLNDLRLESLTHWRDNRPGLFRLLPPERQTDGITVQEVGGYRLTTNSAFNARFSFRTGMIKEDIPRVKFSDGETLIGPAWVGGRWIAAFVPEHSVPWTLLLARTLTVEQNCFGRGQVTPCEATLTLDRTLHEAATRFVSIKGRQSHQEILSKGGGRVAGQGPLPPRVALAVIKMGTGETVALGGYPRMTSSPYWQPAAGSGEWLPPARWVEQQAPDAIRSLYGGDRNFDRIVVGSTTKPLLAAAVLQVHPRLNDQLRVRGTGSSESDVFGIPLSQGWHVTPRSEWVDFKQYLTDSDNRYHVRLGFLGLADEIGNDVVASGDSPSVSESMRLGSDPVPWRKYPRFAPQLQFSHRTPDTLNNLTRTSLASHLEHMFAINPGGKPLGARVSFWTKNEDDDLIAHTNVNSTRPAEEPARPTTAGFVAISPVAPNLRLDGLSDPRDYVSLLLGGRTNLWSNVDLAAAFATTVTGKSLAAHIVQSDNAFHYLAARENFAQTAEKLRPGLSSVVTNGTFRAALLDGKHDPAGGQRALTLLKSLAAANYRIYAKTGTLQTTPTGSSDKARYTSRIVLAIVRWDPRPDSAPSGLVFSLVAEMTDEGNASRWLGEFLVNNENEIRRLLQ
jgi:cell division protein FtsW (lipid II flippase)/cell division protein FtsI/penicillin-binding protein 2